MLIVGIFYIVLGIFCSFIMVIGNLKGNIKRMSILLISTGFLITAANIFFDTPVDVLISTFFVVVFGVVAMIGIHKDCKRIEGIVKDYEK